MLAQYQIKTGEPTGNAVMSPYDHAEAEWPLIIYTVSLQSAVGTLIWGLFHSGLGQLPWENLFIILGLGVIGMLGAMGHLASPLRAPRAILNWHSSWLSREIILSSAFLGFVVLEGVVSLLPLVMDVAMITSPLVSGGIGILAGFAGIALLGAMSMIYLVPTRPVWNHNDTLASFYTGALQIGWGISAAITTIQVPLLKTEAIAVLAAGLILLTLLRLKIFFKVIERLTDFEFYRSQNWGWLNDTVRRIRIALALAGGIVVPLVGSAIMFMPWINRGASMQWIWILGALMLIIGEGIDRWVFFRASPSVIFPPRF